MDKNNFSAIILAAGEGKRMHSEKSKVLHTIAGKPMIQKTIELIQGLNPKQLIIVANKTNASELKTIATNAEFAIQQKPLGTADAVLAGLKSVKGDTDDVAILYGDDTAFYKSQTIQNVYNHHRESGAQITFVTIRKENPHGLGRIVRKNGSLVAIIEEKDATDAQKNINEVNDGLYFFKKAYLKKNISRITPSSATGELYITDLIEMALKSSEKVETYRLDSESEWLGINTQAELAKANLKLDNNIHFMGISGSGASAVAQISQSLKFKVSGCDLKPNSPYFDAKNMIILKGHNKNHLKNINCLVISPAILKNDSSNEEIKEAKRKGIPLLTWQEFQGDILQEHKFTVCVAGAYGKSTTTAMIGKIMTDLGYDPTIEVGAKLLDWQTNYRFGKSKYYICEADEYNNNFLSYKPDIAVVLNTEWDHPDFFKTRKSVKDSYLLFINNIKNNGVLVTTLSAIKTIKNKIRKDIKIIEIQHKYDGELKLIGDFRLENANAALTVTNLLNIDTIMAKHLLSEFNGLCRRLEYKGEISGVKFYDDYAVQPFTIEATANAFKSKYSSAKILLVWEPHTFTRVNKYFNNFIKHIMNTNINHIYVTNVFAAREKGNTGELSQKLVFKLGSRATYTGSIADTSKTIKKNIKKWDTVLTVGAGDVYKIYYLVKNG